VTIGEANETLLALLLSAVTQCTVFDENGLDIVDIGDWTRLIAIALLTVGDANDTFFCGGFEENGDGFDFFCLTIPSTFSFRFLDANTLPSFALYLSMLSLPSKLKDVLVICGVFPKSNGDSVDKDVLVICGIFLKSNGDGVDKDDLFAATPRPKSNVGLVDLPCFSAMESLVVPNIVECYINTVSIRLRSVN